MASVICNHEILILLIYGIKKHPQTHIHNTFGDKPTKRAEMWYFIGLFGHWKKSSVISEPQYHISHS